jgi:hypothetical protein
VTQNAAPDFLTPGNLVSRWGGIITAGTLANWRCQRVGPAFVKLRGRVLYPLHQVEKWEAANLKTNQQTTNDNHTENP